MQTNPKLLSYNWTTTVWGRDLGKYLIQLFIFSALEANLWVDLILTYHAFDLEIQRLSTPSYRQMQRQQCCLKMLKGDASWQLQEHRHSTEPHIKDQRIRRDGGERSSAVVIAHLHTCTHQKNAKPDPQSNRFDKALSWVWLLACWPFIFPCQTLINSIL